MKSNVKGLNGAYKKILEKVENIQKDDLYHLEYGMGDLPYFIDGEQLQNEKDIYHNVKSKINELAELLKQVVS